MPDSYEKQLVEAKETIKRHQQQLEKQRKIKLWLTIELILASSLVAATITWFIHTSINQPDKEPIDYSSIWAPQATVLALLCVVMFIRRRVERKENL